MTLSELERYISRYW